MMRISILATDCASGFLEKPSQTAVQEIYLFGAGCKFVIAGNESMIPEPITNDRHQ